MLNLLIWLPPTLSTIDVASVSLDVGGEADGGFAQAS